MALLEQKESDDDMKNAPLMLKLRARRLKARKQAESLRRRIRSGETSVADAVDCEAHSPVREARPIQKALRIAVANPQNRRVLRALADR